MNDAVPWVVNVLQLTVQQQLQQRDKQQHRQEVVPESLLVPLLLCCIEAALLAPGPGINPADNEPEPSAPSAGLATCLHAATVLLRAAIVHVAAGNAGLHGKQRLAQKMMDAVIGPVFRLLGPAVRQQLGLPSGKQQQQQQHHQQRQQRQVSEYLSGRPESRELTYHWSVLVAQLAGLAGDCSDSIVQAA
jgi:hypothetical protein